MLNIMTLIYKYVSVLDLGLQIEINTANQFIHETIH